MAGGGGVASSGLLMPGMAERHPARVKQIAKEAAGHPLFIQELTRHAESDARVAALLARRPEAAHLHDIRARTFHRAGKPDEDGRRAFERSLEIDPSYAPALDIKLK